MIPYVVINGVNSKSIKGLLISSLPPISKPKIRVNTEEIEGRDGDITTVRGYSAYDKEFTIGLYGEYNVDDVIKFFDTSGKVIFSNEPDKYYNFAVYDQIDFEKLLRFKTATVTMRVQPFKYSADEVTTNFTYPPGTTKAVLNVRNNGNIYSRPTLTVQGSGIINVYLGDTHIFRLSMPSYNDPIILNMQEMNAYSKDGKYLNRLVTGDYNKFKLPVGISDVVLNGSVAAASIGAVSRWI